jgi:UDP-N-acetylmuramoylalanine--D-glutamate ligase
LEHRIEWVTKKQNIDYYNDSKATNAIATITAIKALINQYENIVLIAGGIKNQDTH